MKNNKKFFTAENQKYFKSLAVILASILFFVIISNINSVSNAVSKILSVFSPLILGLCIAFVVNLPLRYLEEKIFGKLTRRNGKVWSKLKRPLCLTLSVLFLLSIIMSPFGDYLKYLFSRPSKALPCLASSLAIS